MRLGTVFLLLALLQTFQAVSIEQISSKPYAPLARPINLKFDNVTGPGVKQEQIDSFITFAELASYIYHDDIESIVKFIKTRMDQRHGQGTQNFYIFIQTDQTNSVKRFWLNYYEVYAGLKGINPLQPTWSYFFYRGYGSKNVAQYNYFTKNQKGKGISLKLENLIKKLILENQESDTCICTIFGVQNISDGIYQSQSGLWTVICDDKGVTSSLVWTNDQKYISIKAKNCYYSIFYFV